MLTSDEKRNIKKGLAERALAAGCAPYILKKDADIINFANKDMTWDDVHKGSIIALGFYDCRSIFEKDCVLGGYYADYDPPLYFVKDIAHVDGEVVIETITGKILSTMDLEREYRDALAAEQMQEKEELMFQSMKESSMFGKYYVQAFCDKLNIEIPKEYKKELLAKLPEVIIATYQQAHEQAQREGRELSYDYFLEQAMTKAITDTIQGHEIELKREQTEAMYKYCIDSPKPVVAIHRDSSFPSMPVVSFSDGKGHAITPYAIPGGVALGMESLRKGQSINYGGFGHDCKTELEGTYNLIQGDDTVVSCYVNNGEYLLETQNYIFTNIHELEQSIVQAVQMQEMEREQEASDLNQEDTPEYSQADNR